MPEVFFYQDNKTVTVSEGTTILNAARNAGIVIESPCNGNGTCGKCKVRLDRDSLQNVITGGRHNLSKEELVKGYVLSCETKITGNIKVEIIGGQKNNTLKILSNGQSFDLSIDPLIKKVYFEGENQTRVFSGDKILGTEEGDTRDRIYGAVVDIGTTTLVASIVDLKDGREIGTASTLNPQAVYAQDVLSRIKFSSESDGLQKMYTEVIREINHLINEIAESNGISKENIYEIVLSGNTCMIHLCSNINPRSLGTYPYTPEISGAVYFDAAEHNIDISPFGIIYLPPIVSGYVGADITSGILASQLHKTKETVLFVDIGTNGEMVIAHDRKLSATSTAAGPAFEGMNITYGMRAGHGAIEFFEIDEDGNVVHKVIGDVKATGICGSGLLDIVGELVAHGIINKSGRFVQRVDLQRNEADEKGGTERISKKKDFEERFIKQEGKWVYRITDGVFLSQKDVRQVQLAKGAVRAGIEFLLKSKGLKSADVDRVLVAGSFGYHLREKSLINIGLLPKEFAGKVEFVGNTSKSGAQAFLLNKGYRREMEEAVKNIEVLELANCKDFEEVFVQSLSF
ncbi:ASKHA domain-containing protein [Acetivibrio clariflavus]|uniref:Putative metal-binding protein n=1 Tax=Acetivibrio clariflavus (strain DSM 19732 / NBRC 101661 / EBR45) TaxID=720554 RepID=G8M2C6_ACECE|nr:ASKHA domain-containing protein [Acetivibrio clariflavus]AEV69285.1 putative metal-binding protein [Acetivibrio clariflavus DSM 19732]